jgi:DNA-binding NtrC family response regulator
VLEILEHDPSFDLVVTAMNLPEADGMEILRRVKSLSQSIPVVVLTSQGSVKRAVEAMQAGAADFLLKPVTVELMEELASRMLSTGKGKAISSGAGRPIVTSDPRMRNLLDMARAVADSRATVLVSGESGTGKELFARYLHENSSRRGAPFVAVNCASLPEGLLESELFGHEKGAFTGAINRKLGKFEMAEGGTILLDEISEMAVSLQAKLLRVLQENEIDRVGGKRPVPVDVRVVATTNRDMAEHIKSGDFREDLYYRLNVIPLKIPPLRERPEDIYAFGPVFSGGIRHREQPERSEIERRDQAADDEPALARQCARVAEHHGTGRVIEQRWGHNPPGLVIRRQHGCPGSCGGCGRRRRHSR